MELVKYEVKNRVAYLTLNRAEKRNALSAELVTALKEALETAKTDGSKVIVLKAEGKAFCAGADLAFLQSLQTNTYEENLADSKHLAELFQMIYSHNKVIIAEVQGHAIAGGCGLATVCDFVFSVPHAKFGYTEVKIGFIPAIVSIFLLRKIGEGKTKDLLLSGDLISAEKAKEMGLINHIVEAEELSQKVEEFAQHLCNTNSEQSMALTKQMIAEIQTLPVDEALDLAAAKNAHARATDDCQKGIATFLNKEKLSW